MWAGRPYGLQRAARRSSADCSVCLPQAACSAVQPPAAPWAMAHGHSRPLRAAIPTLPVTPFWISDLADCLFAGAPGQISLACSHALAWAAIVQRALSRASQRALWLAAHLIAARALSHCQAASARRPTPRRGVTGHAATAALSSDMHDTAPACLERGGGGNCPSHWRTGRPAAAFVTRGDL